ncbi:hypothetical protein JMJ77_0012058 [Colletotrichum scovillei]|uniref:Uncharacterized protein n=1 Tax=Colletotrichum scovillei TaxID=1209932 RepID=A0A9P7QW20_9PEZI|nr:hypothetical protein JMJ77_0012058 [Colletotrichum scovillei]KAG7046343.1 hypothetical protein JMJ78_0011407 [Colletotrichum scovillei]KAH8421629.1 hypothetical protein JMJ76_0006154 [Colletotrichum scovillei]
MTGQLSSTLEVLGRVCSPSALLQLNSRKGFPAHGIFGDTVGDGLGVDKRGLGLRLEALCASEKSTRRDAVLDEPGVVRAAVEFRGYVAQALGLKELLKVLLNDIRTGGASEVEGTAVTIIDGELGVGAGDHVEIERLHIEVGAELAVFFRAPKSKSNGVLGGELGKGLGDSENTNGAGAIVAGREYYKNRIGVASDHENIVMVSAPRLRNDVIVDTVLDNGDNIEIKSQRLTSCKRGNKGLTLLTGNSHSRGVTIRSRTEGS